MKVLIADKFNQSGIDALNNTGCAVVSDPELTPDSLPAAIKEHEPDVLIVRSTKVPKPCLDAASKLSIIVRAGAGYDNIDVAAASAKGIMVANCPGKNAIAVAELAWGLIISCDRRIPDQTIDLRDGKWAKKSYAKSRGLFGRTLGVVGIGNIGGHVIDRARAFGMPVVAWSRSLTDDRAEQMGIVRVDSPIEVARAADVVSVNVALTPDTTHLCSVAFFDAMKPGAIFVNTSRGKVIDEQALAAAIDAKGIRAGLDVYENQPAPSDKASDIPITHKPGVYGTHHCGASTDQSQEAIAAEAVRIIRNYKIEGHAPNVVNLVQKTTATRLLTIRHQNKPGVLAHVIGAVGAADINIEQMENVIYQGGEAACARIQLDSAPSQSIMQQINDSSKHVLSVDLTVIE